MLAIVLNGVPNTQREDISGEMEIELDDAVTEWIFAPAHSMLDDFCDVLQPGSVRMIKRGYFGIHDPRKDWFKMSNIEQHKSDISLLMELLPEFCLIAKHKVHLFTTDELTRGLCKMALTKEIPVCIPYCPI